MGHESVSEFLTGALARSLGPDDDGATGSGSSVTISEVVRLSGGASRETWTFQAKDVSGDRQLILRRDPPGRPSPPGSMRNEADAMRACAAVGLASPEVLYQSDDGSLGTDGLVMSKVEGETIARRILRDEQFAAARSVLGGQVARFMAGLHDLSTDKVPGATTTDDLGTYRFAYDLVEDHSPVFDRAFRWLDDNRVTSGRRTLVHGDLRMGNLIVDQTGLAAVIDWELIHVGDPIEDLAWFCVRAWRFGSPLAAGGVATIDAFIETYERAAGVDVDRDVFHWWLVEKTLVWGVICMGQAFAHLSGAVRSHELAAIGRRVAEQEWDLIELLAPEATHAALDAVLPAPTPDDPGLFGRPTARELVEAVRGFLETDVMAGTSGRLSFNARVAANMLGIVEREMAVDRHSLATGLPASGIAAYEADKGPDAKPDDASWLDLALAVRARLAVANPKYFETPD